MKPRKEIWHDYYEANRERELHRQKEYSAANAEKIAAHKKEYYIENREHIRAQQNAANAAKRAAGYRYRKDPETGKMRWILENKQEQPDKSG